MSANPSKDTVSTTPPSGTPGGHIGERLTFASCQKCRAEWVWIAAGIPSTMSNCGCDDRHVVIVEFRAESYGRLG